MEILVLDKAYNKRGEALRSLRYVTNIGDIYCVYLRMNCNLSSQKTMYM